MIQLINVMSRKKKKCTIHEHSRWWTNKLFSSLKDLWQHLHFLISKINNKINNKTTKRKKKRKKKSDEWLRTTAMLICRLLLYMYSSIQCDDFGNKKWTSSLQQRGGGQGLDEKLKLSYVKLGCSSRSKTSLVVPCSASLTQRPFRDHLPKCEDNV